MRKIRGGGVIVDCATNASSLEMKSLIEEKFGEKYEVQLPKMLKPRVKIFRVEVENEIIVDLKDQNEWLSEGEFELKKIIKR